MKKIIFLCIFLTSISIQSAKADVNKCSSLKKFSKEYFSCKAKAITNKTKSVTKNTLSKSKNFMKNEIDKTKNYQKKVWSKKD